MKSMKSQLRKFNFCTCQYHQLETFHISLPLIDDCIHAAIIHVLHAPNQNVLEVVRWYMYLHRRPKSLFLQFLLSPYLMEETTRKFVAKLWQLLFIERNYSYLQLESFGGKFCSVHGRHNHHR